MRRSRFGKWRSLARRDAIPATRLARSSCAIYKLSAPTAFRSLKETGTVMMRPSNSGIATFTAVSRALSPRRDPSHAPRGIPLAIAWITGMPRCSRESTASPANVTAPVFTSPSANESVEISTSALPSKNLNAVGLPPSFDFRLEVKTQSGLTPFRSSACESVSMKPVLPLSRCAR